MHISMKSLRCTAVAVLAAGGLLAGCDWPKSPTHNITVTDTAAKLSGIPASIPAGQYNFKLGPGMAHPNIQVVRIGPDYSLKQAFADIPVVFGPPSSGFKAAAERLYSRLAFEGGVSEAGSSYSIYLFPGNYAAFDTNTNKFETFKVTPAKVLTNYPKSTLNIGAVMTMAGGHDAFHWDVTGTMATSGTIRFTANGAEPHFLEMAFLHPGKTQTDCIRFNGNPGSAPCDQVISTGIISPLVSMTFPYHLMKPGKYVIACFIPDPDTGIPHAFLGLVKTITLH